MPDPARYTITTLADIAHIPAERLDAFLADLRTSLLLARANARVANAFAQAVHPDLRVAGGLARLDWIDDGAHHVLDPTLDGQPLRPIPECKIEAVLDGLNRVADQLADPGAPQRHRVPPLVPTVFDAGTDHHLFQANGWDPATARPGWGELTIRKRIGQDGPYWIVASGEDDVLRRCEDGPIAFCYQDGERLASPEAAVALLAEYLNQTENPYVWTRKQFNLGPD
jgi:hypothetical protein